MPSAQFRLATGALLTVVCLFGAAAAYTSATVFATQKSLKAASRYDVAFSASQAVHELVRLNQRIAAALIPHAGVSAEEVALRYAILKNRLSLLESGKFREFVSGDETRRHTVSRFRDAIGTVEPLIPLAGTREANADLLRILTPLEADVIGLASEANEYGGRRVADDHRAMLRLHWQFTALACALLGTAFLLIALLVWNTRSLRRQEARASRQSSQFEAALANMAQGLCMVDEDNRVSVANARFFQIFCLPQSAVAMPADVNAILALLPFIKCPQKFTDNIFCNDGACQSVSLNDGTVLQITSTKMAGAGRVITYEDVTDRIRAQRHIEHLARHDGLTGLANRIVLEEELQRSSQRLQRHGLGFALLYLDLDRFKHVNDSLGHPIGDILLKQVAQRLQACVRGDDVVARFGGDEFAVIQNGISTPSHAEDLANRIINSLGQPFHIDGREIGIGTSVGIALAPDNGTHPGELLQRADSALYRAKANGRGTVQFFEAQLQAEMLLRSELSFELRRSVIEHEFDVLYQLQVSTKTEQIVGAEALLRWRNPQRGLVSPREFISVAEDNGIIVPLGEWCLQQACREAASWPEEIRVGVNLSPAQFRRGDLVDIVTRALSKSELPAARLELEITEFLLLQDNDKNGKILEDLRSLGVSIAIDDFGTGYSALSYIRKFPISRIKIDQSFVRGAASNGENLEIVRAIAGLGETLGISTIAEGVETWEEYQLIRAAGCSEAQGYYFGRPLPPDQFREILRSGAVSFPGSEGPMPKAAMAV